MESIRGEADEQVADLDGFNRLAKRGGIDCAATI
jgi:hypothetical protein